MRKKEETAYGVIGLGRFGEALAIMLAQSGKEVIVVDRDESKIKEMRQYTECAFVTENLSAETLKEIGIQNCDVVVICIGEKADVSILITMSVIEMGVPRVIAKAFSPEQGAVLEKIGAEVVYPERRSVSCRCRRVCWGVRWKRRRCVANTASISSPS